MSTKIKWLLALVLAVSVVAVARASLQNEYYLPIVYKQFTPTLTTTVTATPTKTPSVSPTATRTVTPTTTRTPEPKVNIVEIQFEPEDPGEGKLDEWVRLRNDSDKSVDMDEWFLRDDSGNRYTFKSFTLGVDKSVKVWTKAGTNDSDDLYWGRTEEVWNDGGDCAYLRDPENDDEPVDSICYNLEGVLYEPVLP